MATFYARYPAQNPSSSSVSTVQGEGTAGTPTGGVLTVQGDPSGTPLPITGSITATNPSVGATGSAVPASGTYIAASVGGMLTGLVATANGLKVDGSAVTQPVSGTVTANAGSGTFTVSGTVAATQSGTWTVQPGNTANTTPWLSTISQGGNAAIVSAGGALKVDASASTQPVSGTVTANQGGAPWTVTGTGTAGSAASGVVTVQGISSMTALKVDGTGGTFPVSGTVSATQSGTWNIGTVTTVTGVTTVSTLTSITNTVTTDQVASTGPTFQDGSILFSSLTTNYQTVLTTGGAIKNFSLRNNTNAVIVVSLDGGSNAAYTLDSGDAVSVDLKTLGLRIAGSVNLQAKYSGGAPTSGSIRINTVY